MRIFFDARELYFLTQYVPVFRVLAERGVDCTFVSYANRPEQEASIRRAFADLSLPTIHVGTKEDGLALYREQRPDWIVFGRNYAYTRELPAGTRTAMLYHGIGMKTDMYDAGLNLHDVRFIEGDYYRERVRALFPEANLAAVGYPKIDGLLGPEPMRPRVDLERIGLDPSRRTILYAPSHGPSSFKKMSMKWPKHLGDCNLIVKAHQLSFFGSRRASHRRRMKTWARYPNVHVAPIDSFDPVPYMNVADVLVSDTSAVLYEFAATGKFDRSRIVVEQSWFRHELSSKSPGTTFVYRPPLSDLPPRRVPATCKGLTPRR